MVNVLMTPPAALEAFVSMKTPRSILKRMKIMYPIARSAPVSPAMKAAPLPFGIAIR